MNCNITRNNNKNEHSPVTTVNNLKIYQERNCNRIKSRSTLDNNTNNNAQPYKAHRYHKYKKFNKRPDELLATDNDISNFNHNNDIDHEKLESFPFKYVNGDNDSEYKTSLSRYESFPQDKLSKINKRKFHSSSYSSKFEDFSVEFDSDLQNSTAIMGNARVVTKNIINNSHSMENKFRRSHLEENAHAMKSDKHKFPHKWIKKNHNELSRSFNKPIERVPSVISDKNNTKIKLNFLQESQLTSEQLCDLHSSSNKSAIILNTGPIAISSNQKHQTNGLNPSAVEFTPSMDKKSGEKCSEKLSTDSIENGMKVLNVISGVDCGTHQTISNPIIIDEGAMNVSSHAYSFPSFYDSQYPSITKMTPTDSASIIPSMYPYPSMPLARAIPRMNYPSGPALVPQFQVALYGAGNGPQLIRYNQSTPNVPINIQGAGYLVYSPLMINNGATAAGPMYNPLMPANHHQRLFPVGAPDIPAVPPQFAHASLFNHSHNHSNGGNLIFATDSMNTSSTASSSYVIR